MCSAIVRIPSNTVVVILVFEGFFFSLIENSIPKSRFIANLISAIFSIVVKRSTFSLSQKIVAYVVSPT